MTDPRQWQDEHDQDMDHALRYGLPSYGLYHDDHEDCLYWQRRDRLDDYAPAPSIRPHVDLDEAA